MTRAIVFTLIAVMALGCCAFAAKVSGTKSVQITAYNSNFALVKDSRAIDFEKGINTLDVENVAAQIDPTSVLFKSLTDPNSVVILEQNYQFDLITPENILNKSVGERISFTQFDQNGKPYTQKGTLLNPAGQGGTVVRGDDGKITLNPEGQIALEKMPEGLRPKPTLNWLLNSDKAGSQDCEISYITNGINWNADYVALVNADDTKLDLSGWVSLTNQSGASYKDALLTLVAGDVRRIQPPAPAPGGYGGGEYMMKAEMAPQFKEKSFFEYHMYTMARPTTVADKETKQLSLLGAANVPVTKEMTYDARGDWFRSWWYPGRTEGDPGSGYDTSNYHKVNVVLEVRNSEENNMGMPLPKGRVRVYKLDDTGSQQFIGEDQIDHTPKDEKIRLYIGDAFDVVGDYKRTNYTKISSNVVEESFEVKIRNHKKTAVTVKVVDHVWSDWKVTTSSQEYTKKDASTIEFPVTVAPDKETTVTYTIRTTW